MANLSDLMAPAQGAVEMPGWIVALGSGASGFRAQDFAPAAPNDEEAPAEHDPDSLHEAELAEAYARGHADALAATAQQRGADDAAKEALSLVFARLDSAARNALSQRLSDAVAALCEQVIEPAMLDRAAIARRCDALADTLGEAAGQCTLHLHPDDLPLVSEATRRDWALVADLSLARGSLLLAHADGAVADGPDEWRRLIAGALSA